MRCASGEHPAAALHVARRDGRADDVPQPGKRREPLLTSENSRYQSTTARPRVGVDIDGVTPENEIGAVDRRAVHGPIETFAATGGRNTKGSTPMQSSVAIGWEQRPVLDAEGLAELAHRHAATYGRCTRSPRGRPRLEARRSSRHAAGSNGMTRAS